MSNHDASSASTAAQRPRGDRYRFWITEAGRSALDAHDTERVRLRDLAAARLEAARPAAPCPGCGADSAPCDIAPDTASYSCPVHGLWWEPAQRPPLAEPEHVDGELEQLEHVAGGGCSSCGGGACLFYKDGVA